MKRYRIHILEEAENDLLDVYHEVKKTEDQEKAERTIHEMRREISRLGTNPLKDIFPPELERIGIREFRETHFKSYRIIYEVLDSRVYVHAILDTRVELQDVLEKRKKIHP